MYELPDETPHFDIEPHAGKHEEIAQAAPLRFVRIDRFEAPFVQSDQERDAYARRFVTLFVEESTSRRGGLGCVMRAKNTRGETVALKRLLLPEEGAANPAKSDDARRALFRKEYESHRVLSALKGFPRLYGWGYIDGDPVIVMEWIEGESFARAHRRFVVDDDGRVSPLTVARLGRDMFDVLARLDLVEGGMAHRDVSAANVMVRTSHMSMNDQFDEGVFDVCLLDFGSAAIAEEGGEYSGGFSVTPDYAAPEMLDPNASAKARRSPAVDVYAAASVLYEMLCGRLPFDCEGDDSRLHELKTKTKLSAAASAHRCAEDLAVVLSHEPEIAVAVSMASTQLTTSPRMEDVRDALALVDSQMEDVIASCLSPNAKDRPRAAAVRDALASFAFLYAGNVEHALRGEPLDSCVSGGPGSGFAGSPMRMRNLLRSVGKAASAAVWTVAVAATGMLVHGVEASWALGSLSWSGTLNGLIVSAVLAAPALCALAARGKQVHTLRGFAIGTVALVSAACIVWSAGSLVQPVSPDVERGLASALFAVVAAGWCPLVVDYALAVLPFRVRKALPAGDEPGAAPAIGDGSQHGSDAPALSDESCGEKACNHILEGTVESEEEVHRGGE